MIKMYILSVDDEPINQLILEELFNEDYRLICVSSGEECLEWVAKTKPDIILMDVNMPGLNGLEVCRQLKSVNDTATLPIIMVSALASQAEVEIGMAAGANAYISKPFDHDELLTTIQQCLN